MTSVTTLPVFQAISQKGDDLIISDPHDVINYVCIPVYECAHLCMHIRVYVWVC